MHQPARRECKENRLLMVAYGTHGDVYPFIALAKALRQEGCHIAFATLPQYRPLVETVGASFVEMVPDSLLASYCASTAAWSAQDGLNTFFDDVLSPLVRPVCDLLVRTGNEYRLVLASVLALGARIAYDVKPFSLVTVCPYPVFFQSIQLPPVQPRVRLGALAVGAVQRTMLRGLDVLTNALVGPPERASRLVISPAASLWKRRLAQRIVLAVGDAALGPAINAVRAEHGLPPVRRVLDRALFSPRNILALFPEWFAPPQADWPSHTVVSSFQDLGDARQAPSPALCEFLSRGDKPVVFTFGSCKQHNASLFATAAAVLLRLNKRGVFVTRNAADIPARLPDFIFHATFEPFPYLFRHAALVVHHAGVGTCADALRAGVPQLLVPFTYDQPDNATRLQRLGVGKIVAPGLFTEEVVAERMQSLLQSAHVRQSCARYAGLLDRQEAENPAVRQILQWLASEQASDFQK